MTNDPLSQPASEIPSRPPLTDDSPMPFGLHRGKAMQDVPASYFHALWHQRPLSDGRVEDYIRKNLNALKQEFPDGIWGS